MAEKPTTPPKAIAGQSPADPWKQVMALPCRIRVEAPLQLFTVADLLSLCPGAVVRSTQKAGSPAFVKVNGKVIGRGDFDVVESTLAIRMTEFA